MNMRSPNHGIFIDESDIMNEYEVDEEELPDADEEGDSGGEEIFDEDDSIHIFTGHTDMVNTVACSPTDPSLVATGGEDEKGFLWMINRGDWAPLLEGHGDSISSLSFSPDGQLLASGGLDGVVKVWDIATGDLRCTLEGPTHETEDIKGVPPGGFQWVRWHPEGHFILAGGSKDSSVWMWNVDRPSFPYVFTGHANRVTCADFTPDGRKICSGSEDATMKIWNPRTSENIHVVIDHESSKRTSSYHNETEGSNNIEKPKGVTCMAITSDSSLALTGSRDGSVHLVNILTGKVVTSFREHSESVECVVFEASSRRDKWRAATVGMDGKLIIWDSQYPYPWHICNHEDGITSLLWLAMGNIATGSLDGKVRLWNSRSGECVRTLSGHSDAIQSIAVSSNGDFLVSVSDDKTSRVFEIAEFNRP
ncbi:hypothetical protein ACJIZ3_010303 [Penstemon smallii]|uniref:Angio-associated migratory cell protein n=1 Tax=Penstemon smallii TaxID=265156 RepID=A0ABD3TGY0_9LAMI